MTTKPPASPLTPAHIADLSLEVTVRATPQAVWQALTDDIGRWWPGAFFCGGGQGPRRFHLEARPGGRMWEDHGNGDGLLWGTVVNARREQLLELTGTGWGPITWLGRFELTAVDAGTRLRFSESAFGRIDEAMVRSKHKGWTFLFDGCLRAHLEGTEPPAWDGDC
jgi:uncharacterized protein YndB with AHSA1/START domain